MDTENVVVTKQDRKYKTLVTDIGKEKMTNAILNGKKVNVVMAAVGDGGGSYYLPTADMTALVHEVWRGAIASKEINSKSSNMVDVKFVLPGTVGGFTAREAALIDDEGDMIAVCNLPDTEKAAIEDGIAAALTILMHIVMTNSDALTFTLDPTTDTASAVCVAFTIPHEAWQSAGGAEDDEGGGTYPCRADVVCDEATAMHTPIATLDKACLAAAKACELCPTVETASGVLRFWAMKVPDGELTGSVLLVGQGGVFGLDLVGKHLDLFEIYEFGHIFVLLKKYSISGMPPELSIKIPPLQATVLRDCGAAYLPSSAPNTSFSAPVVSSVLAASTDSLPSLSTVRPSPTFTPPRRKGVAVGRV